jgi:phospholipid N-methyltransferase
MARGDTFRFIRQFLRTPGSIGAVAPSSKYLAKAMVGGVVVESGQRLLEFGPGTGPFTAAILPLLDSPSAYLGIERDERFVSLLRERFPQLDVQHGLAQDAGRLLAERGGGVVAAILSGLPFASLPAAVQDGVMAAIHELLMPGGEFRTFQYVHAFPLPAARRFRRAMDQRFGVHRRSRPVLRNVPPAYVLTWTKQG